MKKRVQKLGLIAIVLTLLVGCTNANPDADKDISLEATYEMKTREDIEITQDYGVFEVDNKTPYQELLTKTVDIHTFAENFDIYGSNRGIDDVMEFIGVECLRKTPMGALYSIHKVKQGGLLYIFYNNHEPGAEIRTNGIRQWFYVPERIYATPIKNLDGKGATIEDVIKFNKADQIFLNCYRADPTFQNGEDGVLTTYQYCVEGILKTTYYWIYGEFVGGSYSLDPDFILPDQKEDYTEYTWYDAHIYDMDWVE